MDKFCKFCGVEHKDTKYPKACLSCGNVTWANPLPVAVLVQPVLSPDRSRTGILIGQRGIMPKKGSWGLPGGFVDPADASAEAACVRELFEETGLGGHPSYLAPMGSYSTGSHLLLFHRALLALDHTDLEDFVPCEECTALDVIYEPRELCFESHTSFAKRWLLEFA